jgi:hypothetical protein
LRINTEIIINFGKGPVLRDENELNLIHLFVELKNSTDIIRD